jgi:phosphoribosylanthranilate isomerase
MTKIKLCGLRRPCDIAAVNALCPDYVGFIFAPKSRRYVAPAQALQLRQALRQDITPVGVFVNEQPAVICDLLRRHIIDAVQLHGNETNDTIRTLRQETDAPILQAFRVSSAEDLAAVETSDADLVLLDSGGGSGETFDWTLIRHIRRPYFLAGGLTPANVGDALAQLHPYGVDASSSLETDGWKDPEKMAAFVQAVRNENQKG